jgi:SAM-dependent methyltransferase
MSSGTRARSSTASRSAVWDTFFAATPAGTPYSDVVALGRALAPGARVLDVGCGAGTNAVVLAELGHEVDALDFSAAALRRCSDLARARNVASRVHTIRADMVAHDYPRDHYDLVIAIGSLQNLVTTDDAEPLAGIIERIKAATRAGGHHAFLITADVHALALPRSKNANALTEAECRAAWGRDGRNARPVGGLGRNAAARVVMSQYSDRDWEIVALELPNKDRFRFFPFGTSELRRAYWIEGIARRVRRGPGP